ncbi:hypothetical protein [Sporolactobacillus sp. KGMB 08714]
MRKKSSDQLRIGSIEWQRAVIREEALSSVKNDFPWNLIKTLRAGK